MSGLDLVPLDAWPAPAAIVEGDGRVGAANARFVEVAGLRVGDAAEGVAAPDARRALGAALAAGDGRVPAGAGTAGAALDVWVRALPGSTRRALVVLLPAADAAPWRGLVRELRTVREEEQKRVSRELHDQLGADLSLLRMELARVVPGLRWTRRDVRETVERMRDHAGGLLETVRRLSRELRPAVLDHVDEVGLRAVLEFVAADVHRRAGLVVHLDAELDDRRVDATRAEAAYHLVREALTNVVRHAHATRAVVAARVADGVLVLQVMDDGRGAGAAEGDAGGVGRLSMRERVEPFGGSVAVESVPGAGTTVTARIPLDGAVA